MPVKQRDKNGKPIPQRNIDVHKSVPHKIVTTDEIRGTVTIEKGMTKNLGDFNSARVTVSMTLPIYHTPEDLEAARKSLLKATEIVDESFNEQIDEIIDAMEGMN